MGNVWLLRVVMMPRTFVACREIITTLLRLWLLHHSDAQQREVSLFRTRREIIINTAGFPAPLPPPSSEFTPTNTDYVQVL
jgi:hypothetical protein